jgi:hypothetical protein
VIDPTIAHLAPLAPSPDPVLEAVRLEVADGLRELLGSGPLAFTLHIATPAVLRGELPGLRIRLTVEVGPDVYAMVEREINK